MHGTDQATYALPWSRSVTHGHVATLADEDGAAVERFVAGDRAAFDELFQRHSDYVYHIVNGVLADQDLSRDVTQEVFLQVYRSLPGFRRGSKFATWLYRIAVNRAVDAARAVRRRKWTSFTPDLEQRADPSGDPAGRADEQDQSEMVARVMREVPAQYRDALVLRYYREMTTEEMAEVLGCTVTAAKVRLHRARQKFRECYERLYQRDTHA